MHAEVDFVMLSTAKQTDACISAQCRIRVNPYKYTPGGTPDTPEGSKKWVTPLRILKKKI